MGDAGHIIKRYADKVLGGIFSALADRLRDLSGLAQAAADMAVAVAHDDQRGEPHVAAALDNLGDTLDGYDLIGQLHLTCIDHCTFHVLVLP